MRTESGSSILPESGPGFWSDFAATKSKFLLEKYTPTDFKSSVPDP
jgi:hypothetical protein